MTKVILPIHTNVIYVHSRLRWRSYSKQLPNHVYSVIFLLLSLHYTESGLVMA